MNALPNAAAFKRSDPWQVLYDLGFSVFPVARGGKKPLCSWKGYQTDRASPEMIAQWSSWRANIGIATGAVSGLIVLDLDSTEAVEEAQRRGLPDTISVRTAKGRHVYFRHPGGKITNRAGLLPGWDIRGDGGYVVAPGSLHPSGVLYAWENPPEIHELADMPIWLVELLQAPKPKPEHEPEPGHCGAAAPYGLGALERECAAIRGAVPGIQEKTLNEAALKIGHLVGGGQLDRALARDALIAAGLAMVNQAGPQPWRREEIVKKIDRSLQKGVCEPRFEGEAPPSEDLVALAFTSRYQNSLRFDHDAGRWFEWDGQRWREDRQQRAFHYARELARHIGDQKRAMCKSTVAAGVERFARADPAHAVTSDRWDCDPMLLGTPGGTVDLRTGLLHKSIPSDNITKSTACIPQPGAPERWLDFLHDALAGDAEAIRFLRQISGYCLTGLSREHALFFIYGPGGNGKSVFLNTISHIMGDYATSASMDTFTASNNDRHTTELAMLRGARLVSVSETEEGRAWAESRIKQITGGDAITARFMRQDNFTFVPQLKLVIVGNHAPRLSNIDEAMQRRFNIIPFTQKPLVPDRELEEKLKVEGGQILAWAIEGCLDWQTNGLLRPQIVSVATADYFDGQDLFGQWIAERCDTGSEKWDLSSELFSDWSTFARAAGENPGTAQRFSSMLKGRGFVHGRATAGRIKYSGLSLRNGFSEGSEG